MAKQTIGLYGLGKEIVKAVKDVNKDVSLGLPGDMIAEVENKLKDLIPNLFDPKKAKRLAYLLDKNRVNTEEEKLEILELTEEENESRKQFVGKTLVKDVQAVIGDNKELKPVRIEKIRRNYRGERQVSVMNYVPLDLSFFNDPMSSKKFPTSVFRVQVAKDKTEGTGEDIITIGFLSLCYDPYGNEYQIHQWRFIYTIEQTFVERENEFEEADEDIDLA